MYVLVLESLSPPHQAVQTGHAILEAARQGLQPSSIPHPNLVILSVRDGKHLREEAEHILYNGIRFAIFTEPDLPGCPQTALATEPVYAEKRKLFKHLKLIKEKTQC